MLRRPRVIVVGAGIRHPEQYHEQRNAMQCRHQQTNSTTKLRTNERTKERKNNNDDDDSTNE